MRPFRVLLLSLLFFSACSPATVSPTAVPTSVPETTLSPPTLMHTPVPDTPTQVWTQTPTTTPEPTATAEPGTVWQFPTQIDLPDWVADPQSVLLLLPTDATEDDQLSYDRLTLIDARSALRFDLDPYPGAGYFWMPDGQAFGLVTAARDEVVLFHLDGTLEQISISPEVTRYVRFLSRAGEPPEPLEAFGAHPGDPDFLLAQPNDLSIDGQFAVQTFLEQSFVERTDTGLVVLETNAEDVYHDLRAAWSPRSSAVAILQGNPGLGIDSRILYERYGNFRLLIYDAETGKLASEITGVTGTHWSPDGGRIVYQVSQSNVPCIFSILEGSNICLTEVRDAHPDFIGRYRWSPDGRQLSYIYFQVIEGVQSAFNAGGLCTIGLRTRQIRCYAEQLVLPNQVPLNHVWSPHPSFLWFTFDTSCPTCDFVENPQIALLNVASGAVLRIGPSLLAGALWQP
jgi:hypothetical protein